MIARKNTAPLSINIGLINERIKNLNKVLETIQNKQVSLDQKFDELNEKLKNLLDLL